MMNEALVSLTVVELIHEINHPDIQCDECGHLGKQIISKDQGKVLVLSVGAKMKEGSICGS